MYFDNHKFLKKKEIFVLVLLISFSALARIPIILIFGDTSLENEWGILLNNLILHKTLTLSNFDGFLLPNIWMPPLYAYYLYFFSFFNLENQNYILLVLSSQILLASISVAVFYEINKLFFSQKISFYSSLILSLFPLYIYACSQISSISLQIFLTIFYFYFFFQFIKKKNILSIVLFSVTGGLLILLRGEFWIIFILSLFYLFIFFKIPIKKILLIVLIALITISPYLIRNVLIFEKITVIESFGYNLWKGNNPSSKVQGSAAYEQDSPLFNNNLQKQIDKIPTNKFYRINQDKIFLDQAIKNITEEPTRYLILYFKRMASFLFIDIESSAPNYYNPFHYIPVLLLGITSLIGIILSDKKSYRLNYLILIFFFYIVTFSVFGLMPRYKLSIIPLQIIFTNILIDYIKNKFFYRYE